MKNQYHIEIKECCASCQHREVMDDGTRLCQKVGLVVEQKFKCHLWELNDGLKKAGHQTGAVVRHFATKEIIIH